MPTPIPVPRPILIQIERTSESDEYILRQYSPPEFLGLPRVARGKYALADALEELLQEAWPESTEAETAAATSEPEEIPF